MAKRQRFNRLKQSIKLNAGGTATAGSPIDLFQQYQNGTRKKTYSALPTASKKGKKSDVWLNIFSSPVSASERYQAAIHARPKAQQSALDLTDTKLGYLAMGSNPIIDNGFSPAKIVVLVPPATAVTAKVTGFYSGRKYLPKGGSTYTYPFGMVGSATASTTTFAGQCQSLRKEATTKVPTATMSFFPERLYGL